LNTLFLYIKIGAIKLKNKTSLILGILWVIYLLLMSFIIVISSKGHFSNQHIPDDIAGSFIKTGLLFLGIHISFSLNREWNSGISFFIFNSTSYQRFNLVIEKYISNLRITFYYSLLYACFNFFVFIGLPDQVSILRVALNTFQIFVTLSIMLTFPVFLNIFIRKKYIALALFVFLIIFERTIFVLFQQEYNIELPRISPILALDSLTFDSSYQFYSLFDYQSGYIFLGLTYAVIFTFSSKYLLNKMDIK
jgi:hypothetical protein